MVSWVLRRHMAVGMGGGSRNEGYEAFAGGTLHSWCYIHPVRGGFIEGLRNRAISARRSALHPPRQGWLH